MQVYHLTDDDVIINLTGNELAATVVLDLQNGKPIATVRIVLPKIFEDKLKRMPNVEKEINYALLQVIAMGVTDEDFAKVVALRKTPKTSN